MKRVVIVNAKRTPLGKFLGGLAHMSPVDLAVAAGEAVIEGIDRTVIDQLILGNVLSAGHGMNIARQVGVHLRLPISTPATTINMMCGSGMQSVNMAVNAIRAGEAQVVLAGGTESMSQAALLLKRPGKKKAPDFDSVVDSLQRDGLVDSFRERHMGEQAEVLAQLFGITRMQQDAFAERSQQLYRMAEMNAAFADELVPVGELIVDQHPRPEVTRSELATLKPVFDANGTVTAGNASGINDGAAMLLLAEREVALNHNWPILAEWIAGSVVGCDPDQMGLGPVPAITSLLQRTGTDWSEIDRLEINEAFAAQTLACLQSLNLKLDLQEVSPTAVTATGHALALNAAGGAIAIGHPLAVSGARLLSHLAWNIARRQSQAAIGALCIGGGMGIAAMLKADDR